MVTLEPPSSVTVVQTHTLISLIVAIVVCGVAIWRGDYAARRIGATGERRVDRWFVERQAHGVVTAFRARPAARADRVADPRR